MLKRKTLEIDWVVEETATLVKKARLRQAHTVYSEPCEGWKLSAWTQQDKTCVGLFLHPVDLKKETRVSFELKATPESSKDICFGVYENSGRTFKANSSSGWGSYLLDETALRRVRNHKLRVTCEITWGEEEKPAPTANCIKIFNKQEYSDTALVPAEGKYTIFARQPCCKGPSTSRPSRAVLDSNFSESKNTTRPPASSPPARDDRFLGDVNEFAAFGVQKAPSQDQKPEQDVEDDNAAGEPAAHRRSVSPSCSSGVEEPVPLRKFRLIKVPDCSYATLAAYLAFLYSSRLDFLPSAAFFLAEEEEPGSSTESDFSKWADAKAKNDTYPSFPHAMYRLADCYMEPTIKARAKGWILQNITVETAPFELFSQLSLDYPEFQAEVVDFVLANLDDMTATPGWKRAVALIDGGKVPGGGSILDKLLSKARKGTDWSMLGTM